MCSPVRDIQAAGNAACHCPADGTAMMDCRRFREYRSIGVVHWHLGLARSARGALYYGCTGILACQNTQHNETWQETRGCCAPLPWGRHSQGWMAGGSENTARLGWERDASKTMTNYIQDKGTVGRCSGAKLDECERSACRFKRAPFLEGSEQKHIHLPSPFPDLPTESLITTAPRGRTRLDTIRRDWLSPRPIRQQWRKLTMAVADTHF